MGPTRKDCLKSGTADIRWRGSVPMTHRMTAKAATIICARIKNQKLSVKHIANKENLHIIARNFCLCVNYRREDYVLNIVICDVIFITIN